ncbi:hypothetical protein CTDIVETGP_1046 [Clostridium tyrobutyricum DIVETGP]|uniref:Uncharacterized protein n=1 Tax=Clostridium tyrobutyricum DIVETGP TaxID=1408889 RepID=W6N478_CLOTY|nr:hypothetical protein CTK_C09320 [Clostridium tyrobutyricum]CDL90976.1 hypothetical protein CTDIVETGP_1046 [Clostridium tyrobutyricum DIVETGP]
MPILGEKGIWLKSITAPATVFEDESFLCHLDRGRPEDKDES